MPLWSYMLKIFKSTLRKNSRLELSAYICLICDLNQLHGIINFRTGDTRCLLSNRAFDILFGLQLQVSGRNRLITVHLL